MGKAEDWPGLPGLQLDDGLEGLLTRLGVPEHQIPEDLHRTQVPPEAENGKSPGVTNHRLAEPEPAQRVAIWIPAEPAADCSAAVRALGWDVVE